MKINARHAFLALLLLINIPINIFGQKVVEGYVLDKESRDPLIMATVFLKAQHIGASTDASGKFKLVIPENYEQDSLVIDYLAYEQCIIAVTDFWQMNDSAIGLKIQPITLPEGKVLGLDAATIMRLALRNLHSNYQTQPHYLTGFYRQVHKENGRYVRLIEAKVKTIEKGLNTRLAGYSPRILVEECRRSHVYERNEYHDSHGDHLMDLLRVNVLQNRHNNFTDTNDLDYFDFHFAYETDDLLVITYKMKDPKNQYHYHETGRVVLQKAKYAFTEIEVNRTRNTNFGAGRNYDRWDFKNSRYHIKCSEIDGKWYYTQLEYVYNHDIWRDDFYQVDQVIEERFFWALDDVNVIDEAAYTDNVRKFRRFSNLYAKRYKLGNDFWDKYESPKHYPVDKAVIEDLERQLPLKEQFIKNAN